MLCLKTYLFRQLTHDARFCLCRTVTTGFALENNKAMPCQEYEPAISHQEVEAGMA